MGLRSKIYSILDTKNNEKSTHLKIITSSLNDGINTLPYGHKDIPK